MTDRPAPPGPAEPDDRTIELASRYLDDDLTVDERAAATADPAIMGWVARLGGVRGLGAPVEVPSAHREAAIAAASAEAVTPLADRPTSVVRAPVVDELAAARARRNGRAAKWLGAAAAVVALGVAGVAIAGNRDSGSDSSSDDVELAAASASTAAATTGAATSAAEGSTSDEQTDADTELSSSAGAAPEVDSPSAPAPGATTTASPVPTTAGGSSDTDAAAAETTVAAAETTAATASTSAVAAGDPDTPVALADEAALQAYATTAGASPAGSSAPCVSAEPGETLLSRNASYAGTSVIVYRNDRDHTASVYEVVDCTLVAFVQLPAG